MLVDFRAWSSESVRASAAGATESTNTALDGHLYLGDLGVQDETTGTTLLIGCPQSHLVAKVAMTMAWQVLALPDAMG